MKKDWCSKEPAPRHSCVSEPGAREWGETEERNHFQEDGITLLLSAGHRWDIFQFSSICFIVNRNSSQMLEIDQPSVLVFSVVFKFSSFPVFAGIWGGHFEKLCQRLLTPGHFMAVVFWAPTRVPLLLTIGKATTHGPLSNTLLSFLCHYQF